LGIQTLPFPITLISERKKMKILRLVVLLGVLAGLLIAVVPAYADPPGPYTQPGYEKAIENSECTDHGSFGYFGEQGAVHDLGHVYPGDSNGKPGANGELTGSNNSHLCGNPQN
jgi:hypothetical protein